MNIYKKRKILIILLVAAYAALGHISLRNAIAQTIKTADGAGSGYFNLKDDMKSYQIICKEYGKDYMDYYHAVREKVVQKLKCNYRDHYRDGDVDLSFILNSNGSLGRIDFDLGKSTPSKRDYPN